MALDLTYCDTADRIRKVRRQNAGRIILGLVFLLLFAAAFGVVYPNPIHTY